MKIENASKQLKEEAKAKPIDNIKQKATTFNKSSKVDHAHEGKG